MVEAERRGVQRSWYVDEREWIKSREYEDEEGPPEGHGGDESTLSSSATGTTATAKKTKEAFIRVPDDARLKNEPCPICQEKFESMWSEELQDFIWRDALRVGNRVYHASCYQEATKDRENVSTPVVGGRRDGDGSGSGNGNGTRARTATPDSVLGKRKAHEVETEGKLAKVKLEPLA